MHCKQFLRSPLGWDIETNFRVIDLKVFVQNSDIFCPCDSINRDFPLKAQIKGKAMPTLYWTSALKRASD